MKIPKILTLLVLCFLCGNPSCLWAEEGPGLAAAAGDSFVYGVYDDHGRRDPFWPLVSAYGTMLSYETDYVITDLHLEGIMLGSSGSESLAIINGQVVKSKEKIGQFLVDEIQSDAVILKKEQQTFELRLK